MCLHKNGNTPLNNIIVYKNVSILLDRTRPGQYLTVINQLFQNSQMKFDL